jgi:hypothetical protein
VTIALLPRGTTVRDLAERGLAPGLMNAGLGAVPAAQTYIDLSQGNRVFDSLYESELSEEVGGGLCGPAYSRAVVERAESAPADVVPGLLASALERAGEGCEVRSVGLQGLAVLVDEQRGEDLLIAIERPPPERNGQLAIGVSGRGFDGNLTSDTTRIEGYVLSTDVAPTILERVGATVPAAMSGQPIRAEGEVDVPALEALSDRMATIPERRGPVIGLAILVWLLAAGLAIAGSRRGKNPRLAVRLLALTVIYMPLVLLACAALEPSEGAERLLVALGSPALAGLTLYIESGYRALAVASGATVLAYTADLLAGSPLTSLSLLGPNPGLGVRFYGIGNELEALLAVLVLAGTGAALAGFAPGLSGRAYARAFLAIALPLAFVFAVGRFGADVGAAIVLPLGAAVAALALTVAGRRRAALILFATPLAALVLLVLVDLLSSGDAHLTRSVLDAGGLGELADVAQRRLELSARSFARPLTLLFLPVVAMSATVVFLFRDRLAIWLRNSPAMRAGLLGAAAGTAVGTLANDSGALLLEIGAGYLLIYVSFVWTETP